MTNHRPQYWQCSRSSSRTVCAKRSIYATYQLTCKPTHYFTHLQAARYKIVLKLTLIDTNYYSQSPCVGLLKALWHRIRCVTVRRGAAVQCNAYGNDCGVKKTFSQQLGARKLGPVTKIRDPISKVASRPTDRAVLSCLCSAIVQK